MNWFIDQEVELTKGAIAGEKRTNITPLAYPGSANAHQWRVYVKNHGIPLDLTGNTVTAYFQRSDGNVVVVQGSTIDNMAYVIIPAEVYAISGIVKAYMDVVLAGSAITPVAGITFNVPQNMSGDIIDPGEVIPASLEELLAEIDAMRQVTAEARAVVSSSVRYDAAQTLTDAQKETARGNIDAASAAALTALGNALDKRTQTSEIEITNSGYIVTNMSTVDKNAIISSNEYMCVVVPCSTEDCFTLTGTSPYGQPRLWCFIDDDGNNLGSAPYNSSENMVILTAPMDSAYLVINVKKDQDYILWRGVITDEYKMIKSLASAIAGDGVFIGKQPKDIKSVVGNTVQFTIETIGTPTNYQWQSRTAAATWGNSGLVGNNTKTINVPVVTNRNHTWWRCIVDGEIVSDSATLIVEGATSGTNAIADETI